MGGQSEGHTAMHLHSTSARMIGRGRANYAKVIEDLRVSTQDQLNVLKTRDTIIEHKVTSLIYSSGTFAGGASITMGTPNTPRNVFEASNTPVYHVAEPLLWETSTANVGDTLFGALKYNGTSAIDITVHLDYSATTPAADGGAPTVGRHFKVQLFVDNHDVSTANSEGVVVCPSGIPIQLTADPIAAMHSDSRIYTFRLKPTQVISAKVNTEHDSNIPSCTAFTTRISVTNNVTVHEILT